MKPEKTEDENHSVGLSDMNCREARKKEVVRTHALTLTHTHSHTHSLTHTHAHTDCVAICVFFADREPQGLSPGLLLQRAWHGGAVPRSGEGWAGRRIASRGGGKGGAVAVKLRGAAWI